MVAEQRRIRSPLIGLEQRQIAPCGGQQAVQRPAQRRIARLRQKSFEVRDVLFADEPRHQARDVMIAQTSRPNAIDPMPGTVGQEGQQRSSLRVNGLPMASSYFKVAM
jgi:hypothetical protein